MNKRIEAIYPLSPLQLGILFHSVYAPEAGMYFEQALLTIQGDLNAAAFEKAWQEIADRQTVLRTLFAWEGQDKPLQIVVEQMKFPVRQHDWRDYNGSEQKARLEAFLEEDRRTGFDLSKPPLSRVALIRVEDSRYELVWSFHHLLFDGWGMSLILRELFACYEALSENRPLPPEQGRPYGDYISWLQKQDLSEAEAYWRQALKGFTKPTPLEAASTPQSSSERDYDEEELWISTETMSRLQSLARANKMTLSTFMQGAWALLLSRYSGESDIVYGVVVSGRPASLPGAESIAGLFINTLPMRVKLLWDRSVRSWLESLQDQLAEMSQFEHSSLVDVQHWSDVARGGPLFHTIFGFQNYPMDLGSLDGGSGLKIQFVRAIEKTNYPITAMAIPGAGLTFKIIYETRQFDADAIKRLLGTLKSLVENLAAKMDSPLSELRFLAEVESDQLPTELKHISPPHPNQGEPDHSQPPTPTGYTAPRTKVEKALAAIWIELLGIDQLSIHDDFFELGGDSLLVMRAVSRIYKTFNVKIALEDFFKAPTVADLSMMIVLKHVELQDQEAIAQALGGLE